eukprot:147588-Chlamydomonas_euryale.AAC.1
MQVGGRRGWGRATVLLSSPKRSRRCRWAGGVVGEGRSSCRAKALKAVQVGGGVVAKGQLPCAVAAVWRAVARCGARLPVSQCCPGSHHTAAQTCQESRRNRRQHVMCGGGCLLQGRNARCASLVRSALGCAALCPSNTCNRPPSALTSPPHTHTHSRTPSAGDVCPAGEVCTVGARVAPRGAAGRRQGAGQAAAGGGRGAQPAAAAHAAGGAGSGWQHGRGAGRGAARRAHGAAAGPRHTR